MRCVGLPKLSEVPSTMKSTLTNTDVAEIVKQLKETFSILCYDWSSIEISCKQLIKGFSTTEIGFEASKEVLKVLHCQFEENDWKERAEKVFRSCLILILMKKKPTMLIRSVKDLQREFPAFSGCSEDEWNLLFHFRNYMYCGIQLFHAKSNKGKLMELAGRLSGKIYTTGGGSTIEARGAKPSTSSSAE